MPGYEYDAVVIGSGPNGFAAAIKLAQAGLSILIIEKDDIIGGGMRSKELTLPGFIHDVCSSIYPLGVGSPFFSSLPLKQFGLEWIYPPVSLAHPFDEGSAAFMENSIDDTAATLRSDSDEFKKIIIPIVKSWDNIKNDILGPLRIPEHPFPLLRFGIYAIQSCSGFCRRFFKDKFAKGFFAGICAHSSLPLNKIATASFGLVLLTAGLTGRWPIVKGGSQNFSNALKFYFQSLGGKIAAGLEIKNLSGIPKAKAVLFDLTPSQIIDIMGNKLPLLYKRRLQNFRYGNGVFKIDWAIEGNIPFKNPLLNSAGVIHIGGTLEEIEYSEKQVWNGIHPEKPFVLLSQQSVFDQSRSPAGKNTIWGYCHVPRGSNVDMTARIENQVERFAPGFRKCIIGRHTLSAAGMHNYNSNYIGGDINGGTQDIFQLFTRPVLSFSPYSIPGGNYYICSSSTPPGGGVHGMCGYFAARQVLKDIFKIK